LKPVVTNSQSMIITQPEGQCPRMERTMPAFTFPDEAVRICQPQKDERMSLTTVSRQSVRVTNIAVVSSRLTGQERRRMQQRGCYPQRRSHASNSCASHDANHCDTETPTSYVSQGRIFHKDCILGPPVFRGHVRASFSGPRAT